MAITAATVCDASASGSEPARVLYRLATGKELFLCQHHSDQYGPELTGRGAIAYPLDVPDLAAELDRYESAGI